MGAMKNLGGAILDIFIIPVGYVYTALDGISRSITERSTKEEKDWLAKIKEEDETRAEALLETWGNKKSLVDKLFDWDDYRWSENLINGAISFFDSEEWGSVYKKIQSEGVSLVSNLQNCYETNLASLSIDFPDIEFKLTFGEGEEPTFYREGQEILMSYFGARLSDYNQLHSDYYARNSVWLATRNLFRGRKTFSRDEFTQIATALTYSLVIDSESYHLGINEKPYGFEIDVLPEYHQEE